MSKQFTLLNAARRLENYLSRDNYNLNRMAENGGVPASLLKKKVDHHNDLVGTLNDLFANLSDSPSSELFSRCAILGEVDETSRVSEKSDVPVMSELVSDEETVSDDQTTLVGYSPHTTEAEDQDEDLIEEEAEEPVWQSEGYETYDAWLADKDTEVVQCSDDLSLSVSEVLSRYRAQKALDEYSETSERDIASYLPEEDSPAHVLPSESGEGEDDEEDVSSDDAFSTTDYNYLDHTVDNVRVDSDPTQIAGVETAVERYGKSAHQGTDIDVSNFLYQSEASVVDDLISDDIDQLRTPQEESTGSDD
jgi:hypothetical protein